jgi:DNA-binding winged helix-turn-helix (wHTH) protein/Tol biopolymer transport system component
MESSAPVGNSPRTDVGTLPGTTSIGEYVFGPFRMDVASMQLWRGQELVPLTPKAFDTLVVLLQNRHRLVRKDELLSAVWPNSFVSEDSLAQNITVLRRALGDDHNQPHYIATVPRRGYRFVASVSSSMELDAAALTPDKPRQDATTASVLPANVADLPATGSRVWRNGTVVPVLLVVLVGVTFAIGRTTAPGPADAVAALTFRIEAPPGSGLASGGALSPDSRLMAFVAEDSASGIQRLWVRTLDTGDVRVLEGTEGATRPFWSPDNLSLGFFATGNLKRVSVRGGAPQTLAPFIGLSTSGGTWGAGDVIIYANFKTGLWVVPASGGQANELTSLDTSARESAHRWPQFLPDGRHFLYAVAAEDPSRAGIYVGALDSRDRVRLLDAGAAWYAPPGNLLFVRDRVLLAQSFDPVTLRLTGTATPVAGDVPTPTAANNAAVSGTDALLAYGGTSSDLRLVWVDRAGKTIEAISAPTTLSNPTLSADQTHLVAGSGTDVWLLDLERKAPTRITPGNSPLMSPDGQHIAFTRPGVDGIADIHVRATNGPTRDELLLHTSENKFVNDWSRDGRFLVFGSLNAKTKMDLWTLARTAGATPEPFLTTPFNEFQAQISPDGRWIAYASDESGVWEVYVQSFPQPGGKRAVSVGGGSEPQWRSNGRELFYLAADGTLMTVDVTSGADLQVSRGRALFRSPIPISGEMNLRRNHYVPAADGQRFLMNAPGRQDNAINVLVHWQERLRH